MIYYGRRVYEEVKGMKTINVPLPDKLVAEVENYVKSGWFTDEAEFMKEDIEWALKAKTGK